MAGADAGKLCQKSECRSSKERRNPKDRKSSSRGLPPSAFTRRNSLPLFRPARGFAAPRCPSRPTRLRLRFCAPPLTISCAPIRASTGFGFGSTHTLHVGRPQPSGEFRERREKGRPIPPGIEREDATFTGVWFEGSRADGRNVFGVSVLRRKGDARRVRVRRTVHP